MEDNIIEASYFLGFARMDNEPRLFFFNIYGTRRLLIYDMIHSHWYEPRTTLYNAMLLILGEDCTILDIHTCRDDTDIEYMSATEFRRFDWSQLYWNSTKIIITASSK